ncbi:Disulphide bond corrector protein DsbC [Ruegeria halocynthiae]|uniref:Disulphide bond corrector protein DsbC n=1 Tax=Ruegeria halocynthiae TaxID=985054 RepID=A0A1H2ZEB0_9RHOB|nr:protein-disulfide reductase DsbD domain-containing protein [Ruegeria halocynthiae]SDX15706.1 Disulphide bond corrector protein DsbC [Ruegeria halocynthiae]
MKTLCKSVAIALSASLYSVAAVFAQGVEQLVQLDVLDGGKSDNGTYQGALRLTLKDGWKTYWRAPGDAGIPPQFDWSKSRNVGDIAITWPAPKVFDQNGLQSIGYEDQLVLPVEITPKNPAKPVRLRGEMDLGVCKDVCVPGRLGFDHTLDANAGRNPAIAAALAQRPFSEREAGVAEATCQLTPTKDGMQIEAHITMPSAGGSEVAVIEPGNPTLWASQSDTDRRGNTLIARSEIINASGGPFALDRSEVRITVLGANHAVDIVGCSAG